MLSRFQEKQFRKRFRNENPEESAERIAKDNFLLFVYSSILNNLLKHLELPTVSSETLILEVGSAGGVTKRLHPGIITSDVRKINDVDHVIVDYALPFGNDSLEGIIGKDVLHHIPDIERHLKEVQRTLRVGASAVYSEPNWNFLSRLIYVFIHPEPFVMDAKDWRFISNDPMYSNQALPRIVFVRDLSIFRSKFPNLSVEVLQPTIALSFLFSGGVYSRTRVPSMLLQALSNFERKSKIWMLMFGLNRIIKITKVG